MDGLAVPETLLSGTVRGRVGQPVVLLIGVHVSFFTILGLKAVSTGISGESKNMSMTASLHFF